MIFNGRTYIKVPHCDAYNIGNSVFTLEVTLKVDQLSAFSKGPCYCDMSRGGGVFAKRSSYSSYDSGTPCMFLTNDGRVLALAAKAGSSRWDAFFFATPPNSIKEGQWHDIVLIRKANGWIDLYVDGNMLATDNVGVNTVIGSNNNLADVLIGSTWDVEPQTASESRIASRFFGEIDRLRFSNIEREISKTSHSHGIPSGHMYTHGDTDYTFTKETYYHKGDLLPATANERIKAELGEEWEHATWEEFGWFSIQDWIGFLDALLPIHKPLGADSYITAQPLLQGQNEMDLGWLPIYGSYTRTHNLYSYFLSFNNQHKPSWYLARSNYHGHFMDIGGWYWTGPYVAKRVKGSGPEKWKCDSNTLVYVGLGSEDPKPDSKCAKLYTEYSAGQNWLSVVGGKENEIYVENARLKIGNEAPFEYTNTVTIAMADCYVPPGSQATCSNDIMISISTPLKKSYPKDTLVCLSDESVSLPKELRLNDGCAPIYQTRLSTEGCDGSTNEWTISDGKVIQFRLETGEGTTKRASGSCIPGEKNIVVLVDGKPWWENNNISPKVPFGSSVKSVISCVQFCPQTSGPDIRDPKGGILCGIPRIIDVKNVGPFIKETGDGSVALTPTKYSGCGTGGTGFVTGRWSWHLTKAVNIGGFKYSSWRSDNITLTKMIETGGSEMWELEVKNFSDLTNEKGCKSTNGDSFSSSATKDESDSSITFYMGFGTVTIEFDCIY